MFSLWKAFLRFCATLRLWERVFPSSRNELSDVANEANYSGCDLQPRQVLLQYVLFTIAWLAAATHSSQGSRSLTRRGSRWILTHLARPSQSERFKANQLHGRSDKRPPKAAFYYSPHSLHTLTHSHSEQCTLSGFES